MIIYQVDAFTDKIFSGNPAGVCILPCAKDGIWMQKVAMEMNQAETAFLVREGDSFNLRWFTPVKEVDLCGHATLASAHILWETEILSREEKARFSTRSGILTAAFKEDTIELDFPSEEADMAEAPEELIKGIGVKLRYVGKNRMDYIVEIESEKLLRELSPDFELIKRLDVRGVIVTSPSDRKEYDFISRFFAPRYGIYEDPVTGSAHCCLGPYWMRKLGKNELTGYQASQRGGEVKVRVEDKRVFLGGKAITVFRADFRG